MKAKDILVGSGYLFGGAVFGVIQLILYIIGVILHLWTIFIAFAYGGIVAAAISLVFPVLAQIYWGLKAWSFTGTILNTYTFSLIIYLGIWILLSLGGMAICFFSECLQKKKSKSISLSNIDESTIYDLESEYNYKQLPIDTDQRRQQIKGISKRYISK
ncbi:MAG TPA: hypothetical protein GXX19_02050 [Syntrophomonadaceae bacterium]|nr:hypothetical protein [Syntrophomonadaceae bacterium]